jgi:bifunctional DNA-binding transcriptional regulator/antitoxin component of YhaV-PrlF toxin-antitoxin module
MEENSEKKLKPMLRKVVEISGSHYLCIPKTLVKHYGLKAGDAFTIVPRGEIMTILPMKGD